MDKDATGNNGQKILIERILQLLDEKYGDYPVNMVILMTSFLLHNSKIKKPDLIMQATQALNLVPLVGLQQFSENHDAELDDNEVQASDSKVISLIGKDHRQSDLLFDMDKLKFSVDDTEKKKIIQARPISYRELYHKFLNNKDKMRKLGYF